jgi:hypothetical protein
VTRHPIVEQCGGVGFESGAPSNSSEAISSGLVKDGAFSEMKTFQNTLVLRQQDSGARTIAMGVFF